MEHLHIRLPAELKNAFRQRCRERNISVTSALIMMMSEQVESAAADAASESYTTIPLGFVLRQ